jgi:hypothetical protein
MASLLRKFLSHCLLVLRLLPLPLPRHLLLVVLLHHHLLPLPLALPLSLISRQMMLLRLHHLVDSGLFSQSSTRAMLSLRVCVKWTSPK